MNAHNYQMRVEEQEAAAEALADDDIRVLIVTGAGRAFHAGDDAKEPANSEGGANLRRDRWLLSVGRLNAESWTGQPNPRYFYGYPKPTIAAVNGAAVGGGMSIALSCDIRLAGQSARFGYLYPRRGLAGGSEGLVMLMHLVGASRTMELALTGDFVDASEAERIGLVSRVVADDRLLDEAKALAARLMRGAPLAQRAIKECVYRALYNPEGLAEFNARVNEALGASDDYAEGFRAFNEKREPIWTSR
jgi:enoyl-CoA hydratase/carnithine racemase